MNKQIIGIGLIAAAFLFFNETERAYILADGSRVLEKDLPAKGYILYQGRWYPAELVNKQGGFNFTVQDIQNAISTGKDIWSRIKNVLTQVSILFSKSSFEASGKAESTYCLPGGYC